MPRGDIAINHSCTFCATNFSTEAGLDVRSGSENKEHPAECYSCCFETCEYECAVVLVVRSEWMYKGMRYHTSFVLGSQIQLVVQIGISRHCLALSNAKGTATLIRRE